MRAFEQAAEILFAGDGFCAGLVGEVDQGFVFHFQPFKPDQADVLSVLFPDLTLAKLYGHVIFGRNLSLLIFASGETAGTGYFFFFLAAGRFLAALLTLDFLAIILSFYGLTCPRHVSFSEGSCIMRAGVPIVND